MDRLIKRFDSERDDDLRLCVARGVAYQKDMTQNQVAYDDAYFDKYAAYEGTVVAMALNDGRCEMLGRHAAPGMSVLDIGAGCGTFVRQARDAGYNAKGFDVIPKTVEHLREIDAFADDPESFDVVTFWDSLEHIENPETVLGRVAPGAIVLVAMPIFDDLRNIRASKHYRPGEHFYYMTLDGLVGWMALWGFRMLEVSDHETVAGRENIAAVAFCKDLPDYQAHIGAYREMHATRHYGSSATELHLGLVAEVVKQLAPSSILDYGCGRSDLVAHFWKDGRRRIARYDPAIPAFKAMPDGRFDLVLCCDVMEHIPMDSVDRVFREILTKSGRALFTISTKPARARLPDGRNAHCTLLTETEWTRWIKDFFGFAKVIDSGRENEVVVLAG